MDDLSDAVTILIHLISRTIFTYILSNFNYTNIFRYTYSANRLFQLQLHIIYLFIKPLAWIYLKVICNIDHYLIWWVSVTIIFQWSKFQENIIRINILAYMIVLLIDICGSVDLWLLGEFTSSKGSTYEILLLNTSNPSLLSRFDFTKLYPCFILSTKLHHWSHTILYPSLICRPFHSFTDFWRNWEYTNIVINIRRIPRRYHTCTHHVL